MGFIYIAMGIAIVFAVFIGCVHLVTRDPKRKQSTEMTEKDVALYREAARLLNRLINITDLHGVMSDDMVSETTREQINKWLTNYKKELKKK